ncbi:hypothetical protein [Aquimarina algicola]|uniref:Uncharacterized protein n=1 Tax=Aquimarina algicola TaxID=2589995 RepID=A0A504JLP6_9FLAO|nr:hypothetical protein [Aquimarina algicola]TPN87410.1 hypothetical protein FHK87_07455 [Aquimarina algicola]
MINKRDKNIISSLSTKLGLPTLESGICIIRDELNWRVNEKEINYCWLVKHFMGPMSKEWWLFSIKLEESDFRGLENPELLIQGIFTADIDGNIEDFYSDTQTQNFTDKIRDLTLNNMLDVFNRTAFGVQMRDGNIYQYFIFSPGSNSSFFLNNPQSKDWVLWREQVRKTGCKLALESNIFNLIKIFK